MTTIGDPTELVRLDLETSAGTFGGSLLGTGVPHFVTLVDDVEEVDVEGAGSEIRHHPQVGPDGTNADFIGHQPGTDGCYPIRTYERGVEEETLACGTGCAAAGVVLALNGVPSPVQLQTRGGLLKVYLEQDGDSFRNLWLEGPVNIIYRGTLADI